MTGSIKTETLDDSVNLGFTGSTSADETYETIF